MAIPARNLDSRGFSESYAAWRSDFCDGDSELVEMSREDGVWITQAIASMAKGVYQEPLNSSTLTHAISKGTYRPERYNHNHSSENGRPLWHRIEVGSGGSAGLQRDAEACV